MTGVGDGMPWVPGNRWDLVSVHQPEPPRVTVVVTHYAQPAELARTLAALERQDHPHDLLEIVVADDGSPEPPLVPPGVRLVRQEDRGFRAAAARNLGASVATGEVLCFLDADTAPEPAYVRRMSRLPALLPEAVTVGRRRHADLSNAPADDPVEDAGPRHELPEPAWLRDAYACSANLLHADDRSYRYVISAVLACSRSFFAEVGGFDESFSSYGGEDWEWAHRAWQSGATLAHVPDAVAWHDGPDWAGRSHADRAAEGNRQAMQLAALIPVEGSRGRGLLPATPDLAFHLPGGVDAAPAFVCADSLLAAFPHAAIVMDAVPDVAALRSDPRVGERAVDARVTVQLDAAVVVLDAEAVRSALADLTTAPIGRIVLETEEGERVGMAESRRFRRRSRRWNSTDVAEERTERVNGLHRLGSAPQVEAWVGGWGGVERLV
ncbi:glycosyltransferase [uncultured Microbacterium sp.]|uniref:glycosyltransferase family 2 protein n=1 Tax=uncultured Microbacterium sp. TaxID=191216 RepID=UPI0025F8C758|nr:glycosyltransferase [uncultured Microbacterium sp.]